MMGSQPHIVQDQSGLASTSVNIAIQDCKDFPSDVASTRELYSEFTMADGRVLFECPGLVKTTGIDLMNCPLSVVLKLRVRRRLPHGSLILWHVVLPLPIISKYLLNPDHKWETWIGLLPNTQSLDIHPAEVMFTQSVHLISRPEYPKLRLRFTYHNPQLQAQLAAQREMQQQELRRRMEVTQQLGKAEFEEIQRLTRTVRDGAAGQEPYYSDGPSRLGEPASPTPMLISPVVVDSGLTGENERLREALCRALEFIGDVYQMMAARSPDQYFGSGDLPALPPCLSSNEVLASKMPASLIETHCQQLRQCLYASSLVSSDMAAELAKLTENPRFLP